EVRDNRDPRMLATISNELHLSGLKSSYSSTGYVAQKFLNEDLTNKPEGTNSNFNPTDGMVIRFGEVILNYAEATAELATMGRTAMLQQDLTKSINKLSTRPSVDMPHLQVVGGQPAVNGQVYDDPERDSSVPPLIWEIRRERRIELVMENAFRNEDLRRWRKLEYADTRNSDVNRGAWIDKSDWPSALSVDIENDATEGYIVPAPSSQNQRIY